MARADVLVTDLDGTLLGDDEALTRFNDWWRQQRGRMRLVYASGRFCDSVESSILSKRLPPPDAIIGGVGTEIRLLPSRTQLYGWARKWWPLWDAHRVKETLARFAQLRLQPQEFQSEFKTSFCSENAPRKLLHDIQCALADDHIFADVIYSSNRDLDVVPRGVNKGAAVKYLANHWNIPDGAVIVAGDSGNDGSLFLPNWRGIIVANAQAELKTLDGPLAYHSQLPFAAGLLDGLRHWLGKQFREAAA